LQHIHCSTGYTANDGGDTRNLHCSPFTNAYRFHPYDVLTKCPHERPQ
jgi:hypothetical protein